MRFDPIGALLWFGLVLFSLRPVGVIDRTASLLVSPLRFAAEMAMPLGLMRTRAVEAAERRLASSASEEAAANEELLADLARFARPADPALLEGRRLVHGEVRGRRRSRDVLEVWLAEGTGVEVGMPVASGNAYVGRVTHVGAEEGGRVLAEVELVTSPRFHVGARVEEGPAGAPVTMTVGGVDAGSKRRGKQRDVRLAIHNPSDRELHDGLAVVRELFPDAEPFSHLAEGLYLGRVTQPSPGRWTIVPELDYVDGLTHVVVLAEGEASDSLAPSSLLFQPGWVQASPLGAGDASAWREAGKLDKGQVHGVRAGAAVTAIGARMIGRVERASRWSSDVSFLGDQGFHVVAIARVAGDERPHVLGRLVTKKRDPVDRAILFDWVPRVDLDLRSDTEATRGAGLREAELFTGSGDDGRTSGGFYLGRALLPVSVRAGEVHQVRLFSEVEPYHLRTLFVRAEGRVSGP